MLFAVFVNQHCAFAAERDKHVFRAHLLELLCVFLDVVLGFDLGAENFGKLLTVGLNQEGLVFQ